MVGTPYHQVEVLVDTSLIRDVCFFFFVLIGQGFRWPTDRPGPPSVKPLMCRSARLIASFVRESLYSWWGFHPLQTKVQELKLAWRRSFTPGRGSVHSRLECLFFRASYLGKYSERQVRG